MAETPHLVYVARIIYVCVAVFLATVIVGELLTRDQNPHVRLIQVTPSHSEGRAGNAPGTIPPLTITSWAGNGNVPAT